MTEQIKILVTHADDTITVVGFVLNDFHGFTQEPTDENIEKVLTQIATAYAADETLAARVPFKSWRIVDASEIPPDRTYRDAWRDGGDAVHHDMTHAREIHKDKLRRARQPLLDALDIDYQKADESGDNQKKQQIAAQKQALRDITKDTRIGAAQNIEELKQVTVG